MIKVNGLDELKAAVGHEATSDWQEVTQDDINRFAEVTGDDQWIHVDPERAKQTPFGGTIAHGHYTLSLAPKFSYDLFEADGFAFGMNYGFNKVRFPAAVPAGSRIRARAEVLTVEELGDGWWHVVTKFTIEGEGQEKPVCVAEGVGRALVG